MPMFPLGSVLVPGGVLPLHVFEPRYRALVSDCLAAPEHEFGVVLIERGSEVGGGDQRSMVGTVARIVQLAELDDGRFAVVAVGTRRLRVIEWLPDDPYPRADVELWDDDGVVPSAARLGEVAARVRRVCATAAELGDAVAVDPGELAADPVAATYQLVARAPIGPADAHRLLSVPGALARLDGLDGALADVEAMLVFRLAPVGDEHPGADHDGPA